MRLRLALLSPCQPFGRHFGDLEHRALRSLWFALLLSCRSAPPADVTVPRPPAVLARSYAMHEPLHHDARAPLLIFLHGYGGDHAEAARSFGIEALADAHGVYVALPDGTPDPDGRRFWNADDACCDFHALPVDDVAYLDAIFTDALARYPIDPARLYVAGYSNGGFMAHRYACDRAERVAAVASFAGEPWNDASMCKPSVPVSVLQVHGDADEVVAYGGASAGHARRGSPLRGATPSAKDGIAMWSVKDRCAEKTVTDDARVEKTRYAGCADGTDVALWTLHGETHQLDAARVDIEGVWGFLSAHARR